jgi:hypothetical protein
VQHPAIAGGTPYNIDASKTMITLPGAYLFHAAEIDFWQFSDIFSLSQDFMGTYRDVRTLCTSSFAIGRCLGRLRC